MATRVSQGDAYSLLAGAKSFGWIGGFERIRDGRRHLFVVKVPATNYDRHHGFHWTEIVLTSREVAIFMEGCYAGAGRHPTGRPGAYRASWEDAHIMPPPFSQANHEIDAAIEQGYSGPCAMERHADCMSPIFCVCECHDQKLLLTQRTPRRR